MNRERVGAAVLRAYPPETREDRGAEMLGTLLDTSAGSTVRFAREAVDLLRLGLRSRATLVAGGGVRRLIADAACVAGALFLAQDLATALRSRGVPDPLYSSASMVVLAVLLASALSGHDRVAGALTLVWVVLRLGGVTAGIGVSAYPSTLLPVICFGVMTVSPRRGGTRSLLPRPYASGWVLALVVPVVLAGALGGAFAALALTSATVFAVTAAVLVTTDPRPAIAVALVAANVGITHAGSDRPALTILTLLAAAPLVLAVTVARTRGLIRTGEQSR
ncbi:MAG: hypothetical protein WAU75_25090 [Solirubrobacteraceae bacterium]